MPASTTFLRQTLQPNNNNNRMNYPNVPGNTPIQPQQQQINQNNDVTILNAPNIQQKPQQVAPQQPITSNKRKFSETSTYPTQPTANPSMIQQQQQNFTQNTPQTRIMSAAQQSICFSFSCFFFF